MNDLTCNNHNLFLTWDEETLRICMGGLYISIFIYSYTYTHFILYIHFILYTMHGWVRASALRLSRPSIDIEDTSTSTCWGSTWHSWLWHSCAVSWVAVWVYGPLPCLALCLWHAEREQCGQILQPSLCSRLGVTFSLVGHARLPIWMRPLTAKRATNQGKHVNISNCTTRMC